MGIWGTSLYSNDVTCDVRDTYMGFIQNNSNNDDAFQNTIAKFYEYIGKEEEPLFWYALADTQWKIGRLMPNVKEKALQWITVCGGFSLWEDYKNGCAWQKTLQKLKRNLESPMPPPKNIKKPMEYVHNPWNIGDIYAYQFHTDITQEKNLYGKYIVLQKVGDSDWLELPRSIIQVFDKIFDEVPSLSDICDIRILPLIYPPGYQWLPQKTDDYIPSFGSFLRAAMNYYKKTQYPVKHLIFIGNSPVPNHKYDITQYSELDWSKDGMDEWLSDYFIQWQGISY